jgi:hypothetical protein
MTYAPGLSSVGLGFAAFFAFGFAVFFAVFFAIADSFLP